MGLLPDEIVFQTKVFQVVQQLKILHRHSSDCPIWNHRFVCKKKALKDLAKPISHRKRRVFTEIKGKIKDGKLNFQEKMPRFRFVCGVKRP